MIDEFLVTSIVKGLVWSLFVTEILEFAAAACFPQRNKRDFLLVFLVNIMTNPVIVYLDFWLRFRMPSVVMWLCIAEITVWLVESFIFRKFLTGKQNPFLYSLALNSASFFGGMIIQRIL